MHDEAAVLVQLAICLSAALILGYITHRLKLSPIVGYLLAGVLIGSPATPFVANRATAAQFAEIGVILLMFGVGLHFKLDDLLAVRRAALPRVIGMLPAILLGMAAAVWLGWNWSAGAVMGLAVSVASTVVLIRVLSDNRVLDTEQGRIALQWLIVEDLITVLLLVVLPAVASAMQAGGNIVGVGVMAIALAAAKIVLLGIVVLWAGRHVIPYVLKLVARTRTRELFTLTTLVLALAIASMASLLFGASMALGAFLAGMVVGQSEVSHQAAADALPMRDAFAVLFFVSVGMLFDPQVIAQNPLLFVLLLAVILLVKPFAALLILWWMNYSPRTALTVAIGLAQIGEFSFILAELAADLRMLEPQAETLLVACSIVAVSINPLLFRSIGPLERWLRKQRIWRALSERSEMHARNLAAASNVPLLREGEKRAIVIGYGPVGRTASAIMREFAIQPVVIDLNVDTIRSLASRGELAVYGDAAHRDILKAAGIETADYLLITIPELETRTVIIIVARELNPNVKVFVRARYLEERAWLEEIGATEVCYEEAEAAIGLATILLREVGADEERISLELRRTRARIAFHTLADDSGALPASRR